ncbi:MAG: REP-associated tyrosine transposase [Armatimonadota bacterium]
MYNYRRLTPQQRQEVLSYRRSVELPLHETPHLVWDTNLYFLTGTNYEHKHIMASPERRGYFQKRLLQLLDEIEATLYAWVILPNHYHLLARVDFERYRERIGKLHNATSTWWNREDQAAGRTVWYRFADRGIRNQRHFLAAMNYIHINPLKHGYVNFLDEWNWSSLHFYVAKYGEEFMYRLFEQYPVLDFGKGWDW